MDMAFDTVDQLLIQGGTNTSKQNEPPLRHGSQQSIGPNGGITRETSLQKPIGLALFDAENAHRVIQEKGDQQQLIFIQYGSKFFRKYVESDHTLSQIFLREGVDDLDSLIKQAVPLVEELDHKEEHDPQAPIDFIKALDQAYELNPWKDRSSALNRSLHQYLPFIELCKYKVKNDFKFFLHEEEYDEDKPEWKEIASKGADKINKYIKGIRTQATLKFDPVDRPKTEIKLEKRKAAKEILHWLNYCKKEYLPVRLIDHCPELLEMDNFPDLEAIKKRQGKDGDEREKAPPYPSGALVLTDRGKELEDKIKDTLKRIVIEEVHDKVEALMKGTKVQPLTIKEGYKENQVIEFTLRLFKRKWVFVYDMYNANQVYQWISDMFIYHSLKDNEAKKAAVNTVQKLATDKERQIAKKDAIAQDSEGLAFDKNDIEIKLVNLKKYWKRVADEMS